MAVHLRDDPARIIEVNVLATLFELGNMPVRSGVQAIYTVKTRAMALSINGKHGLRQ
jgi:hypothetical protein